MSSRLLHDLEHLLISKYEPGLKKIEAVKRDKERYLAEHGTLQGRRNNHTNEIRGHTTLNEYLKAIRVFYKWLEEEGFTKLKEIDQNVVKEYLTYRKDIAVNKRGENLKAATIDKDLAAINKAFDYNLTKKECDLNPTRVGDVTRSRNGPPEGYKLSEKDVRAQQFILASGIRRMSLATVKIEDINFDRQGRPCSVYVVEKGGRERNAPFRRSEQEKVLEIIAGRKKGLLFPEKVSARIGAHYHRAQYAKELYIEHYKRFKVADKIRNGDERETLQGFDVKILKMVSESLGHSRINVVVDHYLYDYNPADLL